MVVEKNDLSFEEVQTAIHFISYNTPIPILFEKCNDTQDSNSVKVRKNVEIVDITNKLTSITADPTDFIIEDSIYVNNDRNNNSTN